MTFKTLSKKLTGWMNDMPNDCLATNIMIAIDYENVALTLKKLSLTESTKPDWGALIKMCLKKGKCSKVHESKIVSIRAYTPNRIDYDMGRVYRSGIRVCYSPSGKDGKDKGRSDHEMTHDTISLIEMAKKIDTLFIVSDDGDFMRLANYAKMRGIKVVIVTIKNPSSDFAEANFETLELPTVTTENKVFGSKRD